MNLSISKRKNGRVYLSIQKRYYNKETKSSTSKTIKSLGYLDELEKEYEDPIAHFKAVAEKMTNEENEGRKVSIPIDMGEVLEKDAPGAKNFGYSVPLKVYHKLGLDDFIKAKSRYEDFKFNANSIMILLAVSRLLSPGSKKKAFDEKKQIL